MYNNTSRHPLGANWDNRPCNFNYIINFGWVKYAVTVALAVALRFLCCG